MKNKLSSYYLTKFNNLIELIKLTDPNKINFFGSSLQFLDLLFKNFDF